MRDIKFILDQFEKFNNNRFDYSMSDFNGINSKISIICNNHKSVFQQTPKSHIINKGGCPLCRKDNKKISLSFFINKSNIVHNNKYNYSLIKRIEDKVCIVCPAHGMFTQRPNNHLNLKQGCPKCKFELNSLTKLDFIEKANIKHNNKFKYDNLKDINKYNDVIRIICPAHGEISQKIGWHLSGNGCKFCKESKGEILISKYLNDKSIFHIREHKFDGCKNIRDLIFDFYIPSMNTCIEYNGIQHYKPINTFGGHERYISQLKNDDIKVKYCLDNNITLITISYKDNTIDILDNFTIFHYL